MLCRDDYTGDPLNMRRNQGSVTCLIPRLPLMPERYLFNLYLECKGEVLDWVTGAREIEVVGFDFYGTGRLLPLTYRVPLIMY